MRGVVDGKYYTSSSVSGVKDMALGFVRDTRGEEYATDITRQFEYIWNSAPSRDPFAV